LILQLRRATRLWTGPGHSRTILLGGVFGVIATTFAFEAFYLLLGLYATFFVQGEVPMPPHLRWTVIFELYMIDIQTYGLIPIFHYGPIELLNGLMIGTWLVLTRVYSGRPKSRET
jgi:ABC-type multidrug transport system permease subunit